MTIRNIGVAMHVAGIAFDFSRYRQEANPYPDLALTLSLGLTLNLLFIWLSTSKTAWSIAIL